MASESEVKEWFRRFITWLLVFFIVWPFAFIFIFLGLIIVLGLLGIFLQMNLVQSGSSAMNILMPPDNGLFWFLWAWQNIPVALLLAGGIASIPIVKAEMGKKNKAQVEQRKTEVLAGISTFTKSLIEKTKDKELSVRVQQTANSKIGELIKQKDEDIEKILHVIVEQQKKLIKEENNLIKEEKKQKAKQKAFAAKQRAKGLELYKGEWLPAKKVKQIKEAEIGIDNNFAGYSAFEFEEFISKLFRAMGYEAKTTSKTGDYGIDVIAKKDHEVFAIQAKKYTAGQNVSNRDVQRILGAMKLRNVKATHGVLVTTAYFTRQAREQAEETDVELWDKDYLHKMVEKYLIEKK